MSTRCNLSVQQPDGSFLGIYSHSDGYFEWTGQLLLRHFNTPAAAQALVELGDLSSIGRDGTVEAYHRDRQDAWEDVKPVTLPTLEAMQDYFREAVNGWFYSYHHGAWHISAPLEPEWGLLRNRRPQPGQPNPLQP